MAEPSTKTGGNDSREGDGSRREKSIEVLLKTIGGTVYKVRFPVGVPTRKLIPALVSKLDQPFASPSGGNIVYRLEVVYDGGSHRLHADECPGDIIRRFHNAYLVLLPEITGG